MFKRYNPLWFGLIIIFFIVLVGWDGGVFAESLEEQVSKAHKGV